MPISRERRRALYAKKREQDTQKVAFALKSSECLFKNENEQGYTRRVTIEIPQAFKEWLKPHRFKIAYGGRGGAKSWTFGNILIPLSMQKKIRVLCCREYQTNIQQSVHQLLRDIIVRNGVQKFFTITENRIICTVTDSQFIFKGLHHDPQGIKSFENVNIVWVEEGQSVAKPSWDTLIPTIRSENSEIWVSFNPDLETDDTYKRFIVNTPPDTLLVNVNYDDNPWFNDVLRQEMEHCKRTDLDAYNNIWLGNPRKYSNAQIFKDKFEVCSFETPSHVKFLFGADWGFAQDPNTLLRMWIEDNNLFIDKELYAVGVGLDDLPNFYRAFDNIERQKIKADNARPETIHFMRKHGFNISAAKKWGGSVQDGISIMRGFDKIFIHERCKHTADEFRYYSYKVDALSSAILPVIIDKHNHCIDAIRYALDEHIRGRRPMRFR